MQSYNYPAHNTIRVAGHEFVPSDLSDERDFVLYLPGPENLELPGYLAKGARPSQLIGAEHDPRRIRAVENTAGGIHLVRGNVREAIEYAEREHMIRLRVANLDFDGRMNTYTEELLALSRVFPSLRGGYLLLTSFAARDREGIQQGMINACKFYSGISSISLFIAEYGNMLRRYEHLLRLIPGAVTTPTAHYHRELEFLWWLVLMLIVQEPIASETLSVFNREYLQQIETVLSELTNQVKVRLEESWSGSELLFLRHDGLAELLATRRVSFWVDCMERYVFFSRNSLPLRRWHVRVVPLEPEDQETAQTLLEQVWLLASRTPLIYIDAAGSRIVLEAR